MNIQKLKLFPGRWIVRATNPATGGRYYHLVITRGNQPPKLHWNDPHGLTSGATYVRLITEISRDVALREAESYYTYGEIHHPFLRLFFAPDTTLTDMHIHGYNAVKFARYFGVEIWVDDEGFLDPNSERVLDSLDVCGGGSVKVEVTQLIDQMEKDDSWHWNPDVPETGLTVVPAEPYLR